MKIKLDHLAVTVREMERSLEFYEGLLGMEQVGAHLLEGDTISRMCGKPSVRMQVVRLACPGTPDIQIDLQQYLEPAAKLADCKLGDVGNSHFCITVEDVDTTRKELEAHGVTFLGDTVYFDLEDAGQLSVVFFEDPDGYVLELVSYGKRDEQ